MEPEMNYVRCYHDTLDRLELDCPPDFKEELRSHNERLRRSIDSLAAGSDGILPWSCEDAQVRAHLDVFPAWNEYLSRISTSGNGKRN